MSKSKKLFLTVFLSFVAIFSIAFIYGYNMLGKMESADISQDDKKLGIKKDITDSKEVINIALFGLDRRHASDVGRSDSIMIASLDKKHKKVKLTSIMRDTYVDIPGRGMDKINHAYAFGGPELAIKTINQNFDMNIREFATVDFFGLEKIIDALGGVEIDVKPNEVSYINSGVSEANRLEKAQGSKVTQGGLQTLNGRQAVAYSRIRYTGNGDYERTERQRIVLEKVLQKGMSSGVTKYPSLLNTMLPYIETSLSKPEMLSIGSSMLTSGIKTIDQYRVPIDGHANHRTINGVFYLEPASLEDNVKFLHQFIYEDIKN